MSDSGKTHASSASRRRAMLVAALGVGAPLAQRTMSGHWVPPVVESVLLPAHAQTTSPGAPDDEINPTGNFGTGDLEEVDANTFLFDNIADRSEEEILDLFINTAEAATCNAIQCHSGGNVSVLVVATFDSNPGPGCVRGKVTTSGGSCAPSCALFEYTATVNGQSVEVDDAGCELQLTDLSLTPAAFSGTWSFNSSGTFPIIASDGFVAAANGGGCDSLSPCPSP